MPSPPSSSFSSSSSSPPSHSLPSPDSLAPLNLTVPTNPASASSSVPDLPARTNPTTATTLHQQHLPLLQQLATVSLSSFPSSPASPSSLSVASRDPTSDPAQSHQQYLDEVYGLEEEAVADSRSYFQYLIASSSDSLASDTMATANASAAADTTTTTTTTTAAASPTTIAVVTASNPASAPLRLPNLHSARTRPATARHIEDLGDDDDDEYDEDEDDDDLMDNMVGIADDDEDDLEDEDDEDEDYDQDDEELEDVLEDQDDEDYDEDGDLDSEAGADSVDDERARKEKEEEMQQQQAELRKQIVLIQQDPEVPSAEKAKKIQELMTRAWATRVKSRSSKSASMCNKLEDKKGNFHDVTDADIAKTYHDKPNKVLGCKHYQRSAKLQAHCCGKWFTCRFCHDEVSDHNIVRNLTTTMMCMHCSTVQPAAQVCGNEACNKQVSRYFCNDCKLWDDDPNKNIYHCHDCGICRIGKGLGADYFHCEKCNVCMAISLKRRHKCIERNLESDCPICGEYMFTSTTTVIFMPCGHCIHYKCHQEYIQTSYQCPTCFKSLANMSEYFRRIDAMLSQHQMPPEYSLTHSFIYCNDCEKKCYSKFHFLYHKCIHCKGYNTKVLQTVEATREDEDLNVTLLASTSPTSNAALMERLVRDSSTASTSGGGTTAQSPSENESPEVSGSPPTGITDPVHPSTAGAPSTGAVVSPSVAATTSAISVNDYSAQDGLALTAATTATTPVATTSANGSASTLSTTSVTEAVAIELTPATCSDVPVATVGQSVPSISTETASTSLETTFPAWQLS